MKLRELLSLLNDGCGATITAYNAMEIGGEYKHITADLQDAEDKSVIESILDFDVVSIDGSGWGRRVQIFCRR